MKAKKILMNAATQEFLLLCEAGILCVRVQFNRMARLANNSVTLGVVEAGQIRYLQRYESVRSTHCTVKDSGPSRIHKKTTIGSTLRRWLE